jgi:hypothetical protein
MQHADTEHLDELEEDLKFAVLERIPPEDRLRGIPPEDRLRDISPEDRLRDLSAEQVIGGLSEQELARLRELLQGKRES